MEGRGDFALLGVLRPGRRSEDRVLCPIRPRRRKLRARGELPLGRQAGHRRALSGASVHLQVGGEGVEPGTSSDWVLLLFFISKLDRFGHMVVSQIRFDCRKQQITFEAVQIKLNNLT